MTIDSEHENSQSDEDEDRAVCPKCGLIYPDDSGFWICCDGCNDWFDIKRTNIKSKKYVPEEYYCEKCQVRTCSCILVYLMSHNTDTCLIIYTLEIMKYCFLN